MLSELSLQLRSSKYVTVFANRSTKLSTKPKFADIENLRLFLEEYPETSACLLIYAGDEVKIMHEKIVAVPWFLLGGR